MVPHEVLARRDADTGGAALFLPGRPCVVPDVACPVTTVKQKLSQRTRNVKDKHITHHRVVSKIAECESKNLNGAQSVAGQKAMGVPQLSGSGALAEMSDGTLFRGKNQTEMPLSTHCTAFRVSQSSRPTTPN